MKRDSTRRAQPCDRPRSQIHVTPITQHANRKERKNGNGPVTATLSPVLEDNIARHRGHVTSEVLSHVHTHLTLSAGSA
jgi:hypothetical protein